MSCRICHAVACPGLDVCPEHVSEEQAEDLYERTLIIPEDDTTLHHLVNDEEKPLPPFIIIEGMECPLKKEKDYLGRA